MSRLKEHLKALPDEDEMISLPYKVKVIGQIECLALTVGAVPVECAALVVGECVCAPLGTGWGSAPACPGGKAVRIEICSRSPHLDLQTGGGREDVCSRAVLVAPGLCPCLITFPSGVTHSLYKRVYLSEQP